MFHPISHEVIRQSLAWCNLNPLFIRTLLSNEHDNGDQTALYQLIFSGSDVLAHWLWTANNAGELPRETLMKSLQSAFCPDVQVGAVWLDGETNDFMAQLFINVTAKDALLDGELPWLSA